MGTAGRSTVIVLDWPSWVVVALVVALTVMALMIAM